MLILALVIVGDNVSTFKSKKVVYYSCIQFVWKLDNNIFTLPNWSSISSLARWLFRVISAFVLSLNALSVAET